MISPPVRFLFFLIIFLFVLFCFTLVEFHHDFVAKYEQDIEETCSMPIIRAPNSPISSDMEILIFGGPSHS